MDSLPAEDPSLPLGFDGSVNFSQLPDVSGDEVRVRLGGGGVLPDVAEDTVSPTRTRTMKDFENQITELRKENFNLKLRIYFLEEHIQQKFDGPSEDIYRINIELKVEIESLKQELQERERLLVKASKAVESLAEGGDAEVQRLKDEAHKKVQEVEENLTSKIKLLEEDLKRAHEEVEKAFAMTERERVQRLAAEQQLSLITNTQPRELDVMAALEDKDRRIEQLSLSLKNHEALIQSLEEAGSQRRRVEESFSAEKTQDLVMALTREKEQELEALRTEFKNEKDNLAKKIQSLQEELREREAELSVEKRNALKRDKTIQGLTLALKTKESENEELASEIESLTAMLAEATHKVQIQKFKGAEDSQILLLEKESLLADLRSENLTKDTENRKLQRRVKRTEQELADLRLERDKLAKELEDAQLQRSRSDKTINDLRNQLEKTLDEMIEKEKAMEHHYSVLLSEGNQKLQSQELVITRLTDSIAQKDELFQKLERVVKEKEAELQEWFVKFQSLPKKQASLRKQNEDSVGGKVSPSAQRLAIMMYEELEKTKEPEYTDMLEALQKERDIFSTLTKSLKEADGMTNLQEEMNNILLLRKKLEEELFATWSLRKALEDQIKAIRREEETISFCSDQTSYMSFCLRARDHWDLQIDHLTVEELKKKIGELLSVVKELHFENQDLRRKQLDFSTSDSLTKESQKMFSESLESPEASRTLTEGFDDETSVPSDRGPETVSEVIPSNYSDRQGRNLNKPGFEDEPDLGAGFPVGEEARPLVGSLFSENGRAVLKSSQERREITNKPSDPLNVTERDSSSGSLENKDEKDLKRLIIQLRAQLKELARVNKSQKQQLELRPIAAEREGLHPKPMPQINMDFELSKVKVKDTATQTAMAEGSVGRLKHEGKIATWEDKAKSSRLKAERRQKRISSKCKQQETPLRSSKTNKSDPCHPFKKSRLPIRLKPSKSLGSLSSGSFPMKPDLRLQHRVFSLDEDLKRSCVQLPEPLQEIHPSEAESSTRDCERLLVGAESLIKLDASEVDISFVSVQSKGKRSEKSQSLSQAESSAKLDTFDMDVSLVSVGSQEGMSSKYQSISQGTEMNKLEPELLTSKGFDRDLSVPGKEDLDAATTASLLSLKLSGTSLEAFDGDAVDDVKELRQRIKDLTSELAKYHTLMTRFSVPANQPPPSIHFSAAQSHEELPVDGHFPPMLEVDKHEPQTTSQGPQPVDYGIPVEDLSSCLEQNGAMVEKLKELLSENEAELEREQIANMHLLDKVCRLQRKLKGMSLEGPESPVYSPVPEDSSQRQKMQASHRICTAFRQHLTNLIRAFEELLQANEVDYYIAEGFREQLNQSARLFERLEQQCLYGESMEDETAQLGGLAQRLSGFEMTQKPSCLESSRHEETATDEVEGENLGVVPSKLHPELLMEHLQEIRMLRHQLEESIKTNDRLRKQLEQQMSDPVQDQGSANVCIHGSEHNSLTSEIHFLREENQVLNEMLAKGSRDKQKENEKLRESLSKKHLVLEQLRADCERLKKENEKLQKQAKKREEENGHLTNEVYSVRNELNRLQMELNSKQHQLLENDDLLHSLRLELRVYEKLDDAIRSQKDYSRDRAEECRKDQNYPLDLHELLTEIQNLRVQLEISIKANKILHGKLEEQFSSGKREKGSSFKQESQHYGGINELKFPTSDNNVLELQQRYRGSKASFAADMEVALDNSDRSSRSSSSASKSRDPSPFSRHCVWADKNGRHVLGLIEDYNSLRKQISEGRKQLLDLELPLKDASLQEPGVKASLARVSSALCAVRHNLDEAAHLLKLLWRVSLPMKVVHSAAYSFQGEAMRAELHRLRQKLAEQEKKLQSTTRRLQSTNQLKENMERVIIDQLVLTHGVLKKARGNLELQPAEKPSGFSLSKTRVL